MTTLRAPERVLPTLNHDGTRRWIRPRLFRGRYYRRRLFTAWTLMVIFAVLPFVRIQGKPAVLLEVAHRQFTLFGRTFLPTDGVLLMLLMLSIFVSIILVTAVLGRAWCGWGCPQTVYLEFLFRPIERLIEGDHRAQSRLDREGPNARRLLKLVVFLVVSMAVGNVFLSYFVGTDALSNWMRHSPAQHPTAFLVMGVTTGLVFFDFAYFREQMCTVVCPYARLQSALLDRKSLVVAYDSSRGEPRGKKGRTTGDCVDCGMCVAACPTGIDIRNGLQLECIACTQCMDACDGVMDKLRRPRGLIRYTSEDVLATRRFDARSLARPRVFAYVAVLAGLVTALYFAAASRAVAEVWLLRGLGAPYVEQGDLVRNHVRVKIQNRTRHDAAYTLTLLDAPDATLVIPENPMPVKAGEHAEDGFFVLTPKSGFRSGQRSVRFRISDGAGFERTADYRLLGPEEPSR
jgi:cytochrome c oxidase accessory protein FixG